MRPAKGEAGDLLAEVQVMLPSDLTDEEVEQLQRIDAAHAENPRVKLTW